MDNKLIHALPTDSLPRERLTIYGATALSNQELLAILLRSGQHQCHVLEVAGGVLRAFPELSQLRQATLSELEQIKGIGKVKAIELKALMELGYRLHQAQVPRQPTIRSSYELAEQLILQMKDYQQEHLICVYLDTKNKIVLEKELFIGSLNQSVAHPREIFHHAVRCSAARLVLAHNHPSGNPTPSAQDVQFTHRAQRCGHLMGIEVLDHLIVGRDTYVSLREEGLLDESVD